MLLIAIIGASFFATYFRVDKDYYLQYNQSGNIDYNVYLKENDFYEEEVLGKGQSYVAELIDNVEVDFVYDFGIDAKLGVSGVYDIVGKLIVADARNSREIFVKEYPLKSQVSTSGVNGRLTVSDSVTVNYDEYNELAKQFVEAYKLSEVKSTLVLTMKVAVRYEGLQTRTAPQTDYAFTLNIPLTLQKVDIVMTSVAPSADNQILAVNNGVNKELFKTLGTVACVLEFVAIIVFVIYVFKTRNDDINYEIKIKRLVSAYKSYIQKILSEFNTDGYQILKVETFNEMLDIRDTVNAPILMSENIDKTCSKFYIPTDNGILYLHEIRVEDYDEIYGFNNPEGIDEISSLVEEKIEQQTK